MFSLAFDLGMTVEELEERMSASELAEWFAYRQARAEQAERDREQAERMSELGRRR